MEIGCYSIDLYCDNEHGDHEHGEFPHTYTGETRGECQRQARVNGWKFHRDGRVTCPKCNRRKRHK